MAITPSLKGKKLEVDNLDSDDIKSQLLVPVDDEKSRKINRKSRRNRKNKLSNAGDSELSQTDPDSDFKESHSDERTIRSCHKEAKTTRTKKTKLSDAGDSEISQTDPDSDFRESNSEGRNTRSGQKQAKKTRTKKTKLSNAGDSEISQTDPDSDQGNSEGRNTRSSHKQTKKTRTTRNQSSDQESSGNYLTPDFKDDVTPDGRNTRGRTKKSKKVKKTKKGPLSDQESLGSCHTDPDSDFKDNKVGGTGTRGRRTKKAKKVKKTKKVNPSFEGSTVDLHQSAFDDLSLISDNELSSKTDSSDHLDKPKRSSRNKISTENLIASESDLKENKFPSGSKVTLRSKKSKRSKKNSATKSVPSKSPSPVSKASFTVDRRSGNVTKTKLRREGTFEIQPENISKALRDASVLINNSIISVRKSSQGSSSSRSVSFNYTTRKLSVTSEPYRCADEKKSLVTPKSQPEACTVNRLTVEQPKSARKLWADSKFDPRSVYSPRPGALEISAIKPSVKTPKAVQIAAGVRFEFSTPPRASTPIGSIKRTPYRKEQVPLLKGVLTNEKYSTNKSINKSSLKPAPNNSLGPEPLDFTDKKPASRGQSVGVRFEFSTPPTSSTPIQSVKKTPFPKESLPKEAFTNEKATANKSANTSSRVKPPPNFSKIHERQYQKMENIIELQERRAARAQLLLSGCKPLDNFAANKSGKETTAKRPLFSPNKSGKMSKLGSSTKAVQKLSKPIQKMLKKRTSLEKKKASSKLPVKTKSKPSPVKVSKPVPVRNKPSPVKVSKPVPVRSKPSPVKVSKPVPVKTLPLKKPETRACATASKYGFNMPHTTKTPIDMSTKKREEVSKYRVNRRFELLMKMREKGK